MRILILHNRYRQPGGEDAVVETEAAMLRRAGVEVVERLFDNDVSPTDSAASRIAFGLRAAWSRDSRRLVAELCREHRPDIVHVHNFWAKLSPSVYGAARREGAAVVQTLHNFRLLCLNAQLFRGGKPCEDCLGRVPWRGLARRCYRNSASASAAAAAMIVRSRAAGVWRRDVDAYIALTSFARSKFISAGLPAERVFIKGNAVADPGPARLPPSASRRVVYAGRLSQEKGLGVLLDAWRRKRTRSAQLVLVGDGPLRAELEQKARALSIAASVEFLGLRPPEEVQPLLAASRAVVLPSLCYEGFPRLVAEAMSHGRPLAASRRGALPEIVAENHDGLLFDPGDASAVAGALDALLADGALADRLGANARGSYLARWNLEANTRRLLEIYAHAIERRRRSASSTEESITAALPAGKPVAENAPSRVHAA